MSRTGPARAGGSSCAAGCPEGGAYSRCLVAQNGGGGGSVSCHSRQRIHCSPINRGMSPVETQTAGWAVISGPAGRMDGACQHMPAFWGGAYLMLVCVCGWYGGCRWASGGVCAPARPRGLCVAAGGCQRKPGDGGRGGPEGRGPRSANSRHGKRQLRACRGPAWGREDYAGTRTADQPKLRLWAEDSSCTDRKRGLRAPGTGLLPHGQTKSARHSPSTSWPQHSRNSCYFLKGLLHSVLVKQRCAQSYGVGFSRSKAFSKE